MPAHLCFSLGELVLLTPADVSSAGPCSGGQRATPGAVQWFRSLRSSSSNLLVCRREGNTFIIMSAVMHLPFPNSLTVLVLVLIFEGKSTFKQLPLKQISKTGHNVLPSFAFSLANVDICQKYMKSFHSLPAKQGAVRVALMSEVSNRLEYMRLSPTLELVCMQHGTLVSDG